MADESSNPTVAIIGAGPSGLLLALALKRRLGVHAHLFEQAPEFVDGVGGAMGMYPNGLRVLRWIDPSLLADTRAAAVRFESRHWQRHDGTHIATGEERFTFRAEHKQDEDEVSSLGVRRWKFQKVLVEHARRLGLTIHMNHQLKELRHIQPTSSASQETTRGSAFECLFTTIDGSEPAIRSFKADLVFGCDGVKSRVRNSSFEADGLDPVYTGVTTLMGAAKVPRPCRGICFPSSSTSKVHAVFYPTSEQEQVFQLYVACPERPETWGPLPPGEAEQELTTVANDLEADGWAAEFVEPVRKAIPESVIRVGLRARKPLPSWNVHGGRVVLVGDSAHPPVPYIGQGAMMAFEDVATLVLLLERLCFQPMDELAASAVAGTSDPSALDCPHALAAALSKPPPPPATRLRWNPAQLPLAASCYDALRIPRTSLIYQSSHELGRMQLERAEVEELPPASAAVISAATLLHEMDEVENPQNGSVKKGSADGGLTAAEQGIQTLVAKYGNLPVMMRGAAYDPIAAVSNLLDVILTQTDGSVQVARSRL